MNIEKFNGKTGKVVKADNAVFYYFEPKKLPLQIEYDEELIKLLADASSSIGKLAIAGQRLENPHLLITPYLKKEAVLSSKIEGTKTTMQEVFINEPGDKSNDLDLVEVFNYIRSLQYGLEKIKKEEISEDLIKEMHVLLMQGVRGQDKDLGNYKTDYNYIGGYGDDIVNATFVPASPEITPDLMKNLFEYLNSKNNNHELIKSALSHYQFETIHPFRDGNGRLGRVLIILFLCKSELLVQPLLYMSDYFERNRDEYVLLLQDAREKGSITKWLKFFLTGIKYESDESLKILNELEDYRYKIRKKLMDNSQSSNVVKIFENLFSNPYVSLRGVRDILDLPPSTADRNIKILIENGVLEVLPTVTKGKTKAGRVYVAKEIVRILKIE
tara:strand:- start:198 stop:1355 length:1158 start_codon:yes stop_codon:yes gene_type:complete